MGEIKFNTSGLGDLTDVYQNEFDVKFKEIKEKMNGTMGELQGTMEGNEANLANASFDKIKAALGEIEERSNVNKGILSRKVAGFQEVTQRTAGSLQDRENIRF